MREVDPRCLSSVTTSRPKNTDSCPCPRSFPWELRVKHRSWCLRDKYFICWVFTLASFSFLYQFLRFESALCMLPVQCQSFGNLDTGTSKDYISVFLDTRTFFTKGECSYLTGNSATAPWTAGHHSLCHHEAQGQCAWRQPCESYSQLTVLKRVRAITCSSLFPVDHLQLWSRHSSGRKLQRGHLQWIKSTTHSKSRHARSLGTNGSAAHSRWVQWETSFSWI